MTALLSDVRLLAPGTVEDAIQARREHPSSRYLAGGTDLIVNARRGIASSAVLIDLSGIDEMQEIEEKPHGISIGAGVTLATLARDPRIAARYAAVAEAADTIAAPGHRALATVGGNLCLDTRCIYYNQSEWWRQANACCLKHRGDVCHVAPQGKRCHAAYSADLAPALLALNAKIEVAGPNGRRRLPLNDLYVEDGRAHLALGEAELVTAVHLPADAPRSGYRKMRIRGAIDFPLAGVAAALSRSGDAIASLQIALTGTNSRPLLLAGTERLAGRAPDAALLQEIDRLVQKQVQPMRTTLVSANYRRLAAAALARQLTSDLFARA
jgi:4-hydroxybenzoyl-CoA reductase subunit beta